MGKGGARVGKSLSGYVTDKTGSHWRSKHPHPPVHQADIIEVDAVKDKQADIGILERSFLQGKASGYDRDYLKGQEKRDWGHTSGWGCFH